MAGFKELGFDGMQLQSQVCEIGFNLLPGINKECSVVGEQGEVIDVAEVLLGLQLLFNKMVKAVEIEIGEELAGEVADGQPSGLFQGRKQVVAHKPVHLLATVNDEIQEPEGLRAFEVPTSDGLENLMVNGREVFADVALEDVAAGAGKAGEALEGSVGAVAAAVGVAIGNEAGLDQRQDDIAEGMVDDAVSVGGCGDDAGLGVEDLEATVATRAVGLSCEFLLEPDEVLFQAMIKGEDIGAKALALLGLAGSLEQILEGDYLGPEVAMAFHEIKRPPLLLSGAVA